MELTAIYLHIICAFLSLLLLITRGIMQIKQQNWRAIKLLNVLPHISDTFLILTGLILFFSFVYGLPVWIILKIILLAIYVISSIKFFNRKNTKPQPIYLIIAIAALTGAIIIGYCQ